MKSTIIITMAGVWAIAALLLPVVEKVNDALISISHLAH